MHQKKQALFITDLGFGDAGKGTMTDFLARYCTAHTIVRYNGGPQAAHNVVDTSGQHHTFSQFGSAMFIPGTKTLLSRFMLINPLNMLKEARHLTVCGISNPLQRVQIDRRALVITPYQRALNRLRELVRADGRHGSCGEGVGECMADSFTYGDNLLCMGDLSDRATVRKKLAFLREAKRHELEAFLPGLPTTDAVRKEYEVFVTPDALEDCVDVYDYFARAVECVDERRMGELFARPGTMIFEGAQGVLLDENYGFAPYTTWSTTTFANADTLLEENNYRGEIYRFGVTRTYMTRHGAGPFPSEESALGDILTETHNDWNTWQRNFRAGYYDLVATRYARDILGQLDYLAVTHLDYLERLPEWKFCHAYSYAGAPADLAPFFGHTQNRITEITLQRPPDLVHQEHLARLLQSCIPEYRVLARRPGSTITLDEQATYLAYLAEALALPIGITSSGPTARDKNVLLDVIRTIA